MLKKLGAAMGDVFDFNALVGAGGPADEEEEEEEEEGAPNLHTAASDGEMQGVCSRGQVKGWCVRLWFAFGMIPMEVCHGGALPVGHGVHARFDSSP